MILKPFVWIPAGFFYAVFLGFLGASIGDEIYWARAPFFEKLGLAVGFSAPALILSLAASMVVHYVVKKPTLAIYLNFGITTFVFMFLFYGAARL
jgi:hypothetical protein